MLVMFLCNYLKVYENFYWKSNLWISFIFLTEKFFLVTKCRKLTIFFFFCIARFCILFIIVILICKILFQWRVLTERHFVLIFIYYQLIWQWNFIKINTLGNKRNIQGAQILNFWANVLSTRARNCTALVLNYFAYNGLGIIYR